VERPANASNRARATRHAGRFDDVDVDVVVVVVVDDDDDPSSIMTSRSRVTGSRTGGGFAVVATMTDSAAGSRTGA
jgi:hypothetical protein